MRKRGFELRTRIRGLSSGGVSGAFFMLEDGSGYLLLEDGTSFLLFE